VILLCFRCPPKKESEVTQDSSVVPTKINFCGMAIAQKGRSAYPFGMIIFGRNYKFGQNSESILTKFQILDFGKINLCYMVNITKNKNKSNLFFCKKVYM
jgi:hypothetical protein